MEVKGQLHTALHRGNEPHRITAAALETKADLDALQKRKLSFTCWKIDTPFIGRPARTPVTTQAELSQHPYSLFSFNPLTLWRQNFLLNFSTPCI
jgi:hypothetical protein